MTRLLLVLLALAAGAAAQPLPAAVRGLLYPLHARREGQPLDAADLVARAQASGMNALFVSVALGPGLDDAVALLDAADAAGLPVVVQPLPQDAATAQALADALPRPAAWAVDAADGPAATVLTATGRPLLATSALPDASAAAGAAGLWSTASALYQPGLSYGAWSRLLAGQRRTFGGPLTATVECTPPDWLLATGALDAAAAHPDLYRTTRLRPATVARHAGEWLLVPEPAQIRLATYAAIGAGARGVVFDHGGHLAPGPDPFNGADRAMAVTQLAGELSWIEPFLAEGEPLPPPATPDGVAAGLWRRGDQWLLLLWRDRRIDVRSVGGEVQPPFDVLVPVPAEAHGLAAWRVVSGSVRGEAADLRQGGVRVGLPGLDLTAMVVLSAAEPTALTEAVEAALPASAARALQIAERRWHKVEHTLQRLEARGRSAGSRPLVRRAGVVLLAAREAVGAGYLRSGLEQAEAAERLLRAAQAIELEAALLAPLPPRADESARSTFATLPGLGQARRRPPTGPHAVAVDAPLELDFERSDPGRIPDRWLALAGFDQTVETLAVVEGGATGERSLAWTPLGADAGALALPFTPHEALTVELSLRAETLVGGPRLILLAPGPDRAPLGGVALQPDGRVTGWPEVGAAATWAPDRWQRLKLTLAGGRLTASWDGAPVGPPDGAAASSAAGALLLAKQTGADAVALRLDDVRIAVP